MESDVKPLPAVPANWLVRIPEVFADWRGEILGQLGAEPVRALGREYQIVRLGDPGRLEDPLVAKFLSWKLPVDHAWPCNPKNMEGFIEKAAQALAGKFGDRSIQGAFVGALDPGGDRYYRSLASNLRGRLLQLLPPSVAQIRDATDQAVGRDSLLVMVGREGLFAGVDSPERVGGYYPGGTKFIRQKDGISRAGAKLAEVLHLLPLFGHRMAGPAHWLELGASPGGMTAELLRRGHRVTAVDRARMDPRLSGSPGLEVVIADAAEFRPPRAVRYDAVLSDLNGEALEAFGHVTRLLPWLKRDGLVVFTLKLAGVSDPASANALESSLMRAAAEAGLTRLVCRHLTYNRMEFTCLFTIKRPAQVAVREFPGTA